MIPIRWALWIFRVIFQFYGSKDHLALGLLEPEASSIGYLDTLGNDRRYLMGPKGQKKDYLFLGIQVCK